MFEILNEYISLVVDFLLVGYYSWIVLVIIILWIGYNLKIESNQTKYLSGIKWVFLEVSVDELNEKSPLAMEQVFAAMHAMFQAFSLGEKWTGRVSLSLSAEIVSLGGRVSYIFKVPERYRNLLESAIFSQYPKAEIKAIDDYLRNLPDSYDIETAEFDFWGTQFVKKNDSAFPLRTYRNAFEKVYEHPDTKTVVDPISPVLEAMSNIMPHEMEVFQIVMKPIGDEYRKKAMETVTKLKGFPAKAKAPTLFDRVFLGVPDALVSGLISALGLLGEPSDKKEEKKDVAFLSMTDTEKHAIDNIVHGLSKLSFEVRIRVVYLGSKDKINKSMRVPEFLGAFRGFDDPTSNGFRPSLDITTDASFKLFQKLEQPYLNYKIQVRKNKFLKALKDRSHYKGAGKTVLNAEELATIYHFPQSPNARVSQIERVKTVKTAPPLDLPIGY